METIERLSSGEWFTDKMSACSLYALACKRLKNAPEASEKLKKMLASMCEDETPMVRRAAATNMPNFIKQISREDVISFMLPLFKKLCSDCQDSVRLLMVNVYPHIARALTPEESKIYIKDTLLNLCNDKSWRIRYMVAENFIDLAECSKGRLPSHELCIRFSSLLLDREPEVRAAAASHLPEFCEKTHPERVLDVIMPSVASLVDDPSLHVRITLAERINALSKTLGEKNTMTELLPLLLHLLRDEMSDVRLNVISHLESIIEVIGFKTLAGYLLPSITELAGDKKWRVRLAIVQKIPMLAKQTRMELNELLQSLCITWLKDPVYTIRELAAKNLKILTEILGIEWIKQSVFPDILEMTMSGNYHHRIITIICIKTIFPVIFPDEFFNEILKIILMLCKDPVPNIRVNVTFALHEIMLFLNDENIREQIIKNDIIPVLEQLRTDEDLDVSYYSEIAYRAAEKLLAGETPPQPVFYSQAPL